MINTNRPRWPGLASRPTTLAGMQKRMQHFRSDESERRADETLVRATDVFIATYPKCGTTLLQQMLHTLRTRGDMSFDEITEVVPWFESAWDIGIDPGAEQVASPRVFKTHRPVDKLPDVGRFIHITRDPLSLADSFYRFFSGWAFEAGSISIDEFAQKMILGGTGSGLYWHHVLTWWPRRQDKNVLFLCYEDFLDNPAAIVSSARTHRCSMTIRCTLFVGKMSGFTMPRANVIWTATTMCHTLPALRNTWALPLIQSLLR